MFVIFPCSPPSGSAHEYSTTAYPDGIVHSTNPGARTAEVAEYGTDEPIKWRGFVSHKV